MKRSALTKSGLESKSRAKYGSDIESFSPSNDETNDKNLKTPELL